MNRHRLSVLAASLSVFILVSLYGHKALSWDLIELQDIDITHKQFLSSVDNDFPSGKSSSESTLDFGLVGFDNLFFSAELQDKRYFDQYSLLGYSINTGVMLTDRLSVGWWQQSQNYLNYENGQFPAGMTNSGIIIRLKLYKGAQATGIW